MVVVTVSKQVMVMVTVGLTVTVTVMAVAVGSKQFHSQGEFQNHIKVDIFKYLNEHWAGGYQVLPRRVD